jgi:hypothetical protein
MGVEVVDDIGKMPELAFLSVGPSCAVFLFTGHALTFESAAGTLVGGAGLL